QAVQALLKPDADEEVQTHLKAATSKLLAAREVLYSVNIHLLDVWHLDESKLDVPFPAAIAAGTACNLMTTGRALERLKEVYPERVQQLRAKLDEAVQPPVLEVIGGIY